MPGGPRTQEGENPEPKSLRAIAELAVAAAVTVMTATAAAVLAAGQGEPVYAVTMGSDGVVDVVVRDFRNAEALTEQLHALGAPASSSRTG